MQFRSPRHEDASIIIPDEVARLQHPFNGTVCSKRGDEYSITNNIIDFLGRNEPPISWAQSSNHWTVTAKIYEDIWRKRSIGLLSGDDFPIRKELDFLTDWLQPTPNGCYLDVGCSTALYARHLKKQAPESHVVALDFSMPMLQQARQKATQDQADLFLLRTDARFMPFYGGRFDGLMMGGTLNELTDPLKVLFECRRVLADSGSFFMMHLLQSPTWYGRLMQQTAAMSGLHFWSLAESNALFKRAAFAVSEQFTKGIVCFSKLMPE